jgi:hypothetical protein
MSHITKRRPKQQARTEPADTLRTNTREVGNRHPLLSHQIVKVYVASNGQFVNCRSGASVFTWVDHEVTLRLPGKPLPLFPEPKVPAVPPARYADPPESGRRGYPYWTAA